MRAIDAALTATYPLIVVLGALVCLRYLPALRSLTDGIRNLVCAQLVMTVGVMWEQILYGFGRISGNYIAIATTPDLVGIGKILYIAALVYMMFAFREITSIAFAWWHFPAAAAIFWVVVAMVLML